MILLVFLACTVRLASAHADGLCDPETCHPDEADEGLATERLDDNAASDPAPASLTAAQMTPDWELDADAREAALRGDASWLGRFDISVTWRRAWAAADELRQRDELWLVGTWRL